MRFQRKLILINKMPHKSSHSKPKTYPKATGQALLTTYSRNKQGCGCGCSGRFSKKKVK